MERLYQTFEIKDVDLIKQQMLAWSSGFNVCCFLDNQKYESNYNSFECLVGVGCKAIFKPEANFFPSLTSFVEAHNDWILGHFNYEVGNKIFTSSTKPDNLEEFPDCFLFVPEVILFLKEHRLTIGVIEKDPGVIFSSIINHVVLHYPLNAVLFNPAITREAYISSIKKLKDHILKGDCYEINFCQKFYASGKINPLSAYLKLVEISSNPFSAFYCVDKNYLLSASPERYIKKVGDKLISQPIKGTAARNVSDIGADKASKQELESSAKERSENVMIVDLVRNDLSIICEEGSVTVEELFGVYSFPLVHQMISTVIGRLKKGLSFSDVLKATFPMGSMTGAPKKKVVELIERYEQNKRGIYSGTVGYITPEKDFDFNVVIRSIVYNKSTSHLSFQVGSAITAASDPEKEYEECLLKAKGMVKVFSGA